MNFTTFGPAVRYALTLGLVAGTALVPSASIAGVDVFLHARPAITAAGPDRVHVAQADADMPPATPASYSREQAERGEEKYEDQCEECHGEDLEGGLNGGPPLSGMRFEQRYFEGAPASGLFLFMSTAMPPNAPGRFSANVYTDIMAYILQQNGFQPGAELPSDVDALDNLILEK